MMAGDLSAVARIADQVHPAHPESAAVAAERLALYPAGCLVLERDGDPIGYALSHPWHADTPPPLDTLLGRLPTSPGTFYLHDLALLPAARGLRAGTAAVRLLADQARRDRLPTASLVAVSGSVPFWRRQGFVVADSPALRDKLASYGADARFMVRRLR